MQNKESLSYREESDFGEFMSRVLLIIGQIIAMSGGWAFGLMILFTIFHHKKPFLPWTLLIIMVPIGAFVGPFLMVLSKLIERR